MRCRLVLVGGCLSACIAAIGCSAPAAAPSAAPIAGAGTAGAPGTLDLPGMHASAPAAGGSSDAAGAAGVMASARAGRGGTGEAAGRNAEAGRASAAAAGSGNDALSQLPAKPVPSVETASFKPSGAITDIADDSAIFAHPSAPELSVVIADDKDDSTGGVGVFDMQGKLLQFRQDGKIGNVDLRTGFPFGGKSIVLVGANNRTTDTLIFWQLDPATRQLSAPVSAAIHTVSPNYGFCLYHSAASGKFYAFVTQETGASVMEQYELAENAGKVTATKVRSFELGSITEGCVADDELGKLYVAQEDVALWKYDAEPSGGSMRVKIAAVGDGKVVADLEGVALAKGPDNSGYVVVSIQSESRFVTYDRQTGAFLRGFSVGANGSIDATTECDGLDISTANLGPGFAKGALVVHDGSNTGGESSNLKFVPLQ